ncbi:alcohol oxidase [Artomyces pyxidatus]|uniref:Alcohol oxidase n=1 Tax=Artomyces pyxidatus TaxID=48021 RepID=A0ACB8SU19_9AGAM|nr:alcohol oxidase [Artomyces pyxidatus]
MPSIVKVGAAALALSTLGALGLSSHRPHGVITDPRLFATQTFDYIVVGGGTAGLVVAARLTEDAKVTVGVIQAGEYRPNDPIINLAGGYSSAIGNATYDWNFLTTPQTGLGGRVLSAPRGRVLGGSSAINAPLWQRASAVEYDNWGSPFGNGDSWSWKGLLPYFKKSENWTRPPIVLPGQTIPRDLTATHGTGGPLQLSYNNFYPDPVVPAIAAINRLGVPTNSDPDSGNGVNATLGGRTVSASQGVRSYSASAYFAPNAARPNLLVLTGAIAGKIVFRTQKGTITATGVEYFVNGTKYTAAVDSEVILSAGSFQSPQLLELSGVGNATFLKTVGIHPILDLPGDHTLTSLDFIVKPGVLTLDALSFNATFSAEQNAQYQKNRTGALSYSSPAWSTIPLKSFITKGNLTNITDSFLPSLRPANGLQGVQFSLLKQHLTDGKIGWGEFTMIPSGGLASLPQPNTSYISPIFLNFHPFSRGSVHINSSNLTAAPLINPNYLSNPIDRAISSLGAAFIREWAGTTPLASLVQSVNTPNATVRSLEQLSDYVVGNVEPGLHYFGTTAMAAKSLGGVVDPNLKVYGLANVRVVDASIIPATIGTAMQASVYAIAEKQQPLLSLLISTRSLLTHPLLSSMDSFTSLFNSVSAAFTDSAPEDASPATPIDSESGGKGTGLSCIVA